MTQLAIRLTERFCEEFSNNAKFQGAGYAESGRVTIHEGTDDFVDASVAGSEVYGVTLSFEEGAIFVCCACPHFDSGARCKHLWAALVVAERKGHLSAAGRCPTVELVSEWGPEPGDLDLDEDDDPEIPAIRAQLKPRSPAWREFVSSIDSAPDSHKLAEEERLYWIDVPKARSSGTPHLEVGVRKRKQDGSWGALQTRSFSPAEVEQLADPQDRQILQLLFGAADRYYDAYRRDPSFPLSEGLQKTVIPLLAATGRFHLSPSGVPTDRHPIRWDDRGVWDFKIRMEREGEQWVLRGTLERDGETMDLAAPALILGSGHVFTSDRVAPFRYEGSYGWILRLRGKAPIRIPIREQEEFRRAVLEAAEPPAIDWPEPLRVQERRVASRPHLRIFIPKFKDPEYGTDRLYADLSFEYGDTKIPASDPRTQVLTEDNQVLITRDDAAESAARETLLEQRFLLRSRTWDAQQVPHDFEIHPKRLANAVDALLQAGWSIEAEKGVYRRPGSFRINVVSGIDWFDVEGGAEFEGQFVPFPKLLTALREGKRFVTLGDGSQGILPEEWLEKLGFVLGAAEGHGETLRYKPSQAFLLDALLAAEPQASCDEAFVNLRDRLRTFDGIRPADPPPTFRGELRPYQKTGLGWMRFLREFAFGGCLADDMGLGKTVQVLALLDSRRPERAGPSLVVAPRSLIFNWKAEAGRFAPELRVLDQSDCGRARSPEALREADVVLTTYGVLRRDAPVLKDFSFDYVILDEAQAIKNADTATAKAVRLLKGRHRLVLSGTPIENHLGELWSLFEFLNPGMLGRAAAFQSGLKGNDRELLARALRPFLLRRTKAQVAPELPEKLEQTVHCDLEPAERKAYDELRNHYRASLLGLEDLRKSKIMILEALLRLRQAACHPGLIDPNLRDRSSTKLDLLLDRVRDVIEEGHKALVFSQFTSLLSILRERLDREKVVYEYLDGKTRDRQARVERFQTDPRCPLFLISLKAGGLGLNLTAAEYVFLLDPWWNPAVEAQAIDRTHRIGQTRRVFAYRIVARDTVEEKVLALQDSKRELADAILGADKSLLQGLDREDLELLLS